MKRTFTFRSSLYMLSALVVVAAFASCVKQAGHYITSSAVKSGNIQFFVNGDTTHTLATTVDTVAFTSYSTPQTTVTGKNGQKYLSCNVQFSGNTKGTYSLTNIGVKYISKNNVYISTSSNIGTATVDSINVNKGYIAGSFTGRVIVAAADTQTVVGTFTIQQ